MDRRVTHVGLALQPWGSCLRAQDWGRWPRPDVWWQSRSVPARWACYGVGKGGQGEVEERSRDKQKLW